MKPSIKSHSHWWLSSPYSLLDYLGDYPCEIDIDMYNELGNIHISVDLCQSSEYYSNYDGRILRATVNFIKDKYFYLGMLPPIKI